MKALAGCIRRAAKVGLLASAVVIATLAVSQDARPASASGTEIFFSKYSTSPVRASPISVPLGGEPIDVYVWVKDVKDSSGASCFEVEFEYDNSYLTVVELTAESVWLGSTGRSVSCLPDPVIGESTATLSCITFQPPPPYGPGCSSNPPHCSGLLATVTVQAAPDAVLGTTSLDFTDSTFLYGTPPDPNDLWDSIIPTTEYSLDVLVAPCADFDGDDTVRISDIIYIINNYRTDDPLADLDGSGMVLINDVLIGVSQYRMDCVRD